MASHAPCTPIQVPYFAPEEQLPEPLPTPKELELLVEELWELDQNDDSECEESLAADKRGWDGPWDYEVFEMPDTIRFSKHYVVKIARNMSLNEVSAMIYVKENTNIPVPTVYAYLENRYHGFIVMEYIEGISLKEYIQGDPPRRTIPSCKNLGDVSDDEPSDVKPLRLDTNKRDDIAKQLGAYLEEMSRLPAPKYFGGIAPPGSKRNFFGPYDTAEEVNRAIFEKVTLYRLRHDEAFHSSFASPITHACDRAFATFCPEDGAPVFTHGRFAPENILIRNDGTAFLTRFDSAAFYPRSYEYVSMDSRGLRYRADPTWEQIRATFPVKPETYGEKLLALWMPEMAFREEIGDLHNCHVLWMEAISRGVIEEAPEPVPAWYEALVQKYDPSAADQDTSSDS